MRRGFTLIELLVVVAIVLILAAIILPLIPWGKAEDRTITIAKTWTDSSINNGYSSNEYYVSDTDGDTYLVDGPQVYGRLVQDHTYQVELSKKLLGNMVLTGVVREINTNTAEAMP
jgi:prepilin-type N-terminal cleavage/methylation domain-containing protein